MPRRVKGPDGIERNFPDDATDAEIADALESAPAPGLLKAGNIDLTRRPKVKNPDGTTSTVRSLSFEEDGKEILIPTVVGNRVVSDDEAIQHYRKTGEHLGIFDSPEHATSYAEQLHNDYAAGRYDPSKGSDRTRVDTNTIGVDHDKLAHAVTDAAVRHLPASLAPAAAMFGTFITDALASTLEMVSAPESIATAGMGRVPDRIPPSTIPKPSPQTLRNIAQIAASPVKGTAKVLGKKVAKDFGDAFSDAVLTHLEERLATRAAPMTLKPPPVVDVAPTAPVASPVPPRTAPVATPAPMPQTPPVVSEPVLAPSVEPPVKTYGAAWADRRAEGVRNGTVGNQPADIAKFREAARKAAEASGKPIPPAVEKALNAPIKSEQRAMNEVAQMARQLKSGRLTDAEDKAAVELVRNGADVKATVQAILEQRGAVEDPAAALAAKLGTPNDVEVKADMARRYRRGQKSLSGYDK